MSGNRKKPQSRTQKLFANHRAGCINSLVCIGFTMTAAVVAPLPVPVAADLVLLDSSTVEARKRRREILSSQRSLAPETVCSTACTESVPTTKKRRVSTDESSDSDMESKTTLSSKGGKKPQMKYDPDVPMTKDDAAAWRREQRRKRNRESAAASRQRQRDRIAELEIEVGDWKDKYDEMMSKIRKLEDITGSSKTAEFVPATRAETPQPETQTVTPRASPTIESSFSIALAGEVSPEADHEVVSEEDEQELHPTKMTSRPAQSQAHPLTLIESVLRRPPLTAWVFPHLF
jgi:hypothetical protein